MRNGQIRRVVFLALAATLIAMTPSARAQAASQDQPPDRSLCEKAQTDAETAKLDGEIPFAGASYQTTMFYAIPYGNCRVLSLYRLGPKLPVSASTSAEARKQQAEYAGKTAAPRFVARYVDDRPDAYFQPRWADQPKCPALVPAIEKLEKILAPKFAGDGPYRGTMSALTDQPAYEAWTQGPVYPKTNSLYVVNIRARISGERTPLSEWIDETMTALAPCLTDSKPSLQ